MKVALGDVMFTYLDPIEVPSQEDSFALAAGFRLNYERLSLASVELFLE